MNSIEQEIYHYGAIYNNAVAAVRHLRNQMAPLIEEAQLATAILRDSQMTYKENKVLLSVYEEFGK